MRMHLLAGFLVAVVAATVAARAGGDGQKAEPKPAKPITLVGCVGTDEAKPGQLTFNDAKTGTTYRLSGADTREYVGKSVQIVGGSDDKRLKVRAGLNPSPNVAAQAGAMDPTRAAMVAQGSERGTGSAEATELPEFKVKSVKPASGNCPPAK